MTLLLFCARLPKNNLILKRVAIDFRNVIAYFLGISFVYANEPSTAKDSLYAEDKLRKEPQTFSHLNVKCRGLTNAELKTQIVDFDIERGITYCEIYKKQILTS